MIVRTTILCLIATAIASTPGGSATRGYAESNNAFAVDLYHQIAKERKERENIFFSPFSMSTALTMAWAGADGETADEMATVLHYDPTDRTEPHRQIKKLVDTMTADPDEDTFVVTVANDLWRDKEVTFNPNFANEMSTYYEGAFHAVDFKKDTKGARKKINKRIANQTRGKIPELLQKGDVTPKTIAVLTNAIYLKGKWEYPFHKEETVDQPFHLNADKTVETPMMRLSEKSLRFYRGEGFQMVALPYVGEKASMTLLVPDAIDGLPALEKRLSAETLSDWIGGMRKKKVVVHMPKFTLRDHTVMNPHLEALGMRQAFDLFQADLSRMFEVQHDGFPYIDKVIHEAFIEVDEEKTEATAATAVVINTWKSLTVPFVIRADHPYLYGRL